ncbi:S-adenosyl-L-methionine-dependent methyltransferase [Phlebopus sp. FC_14]|nr:S-adenosyl-L-methionine-dependent methyltransferase [Phlebopus sp. FC_14]
MATFARTTFDTALYAASRPTYPQALFEYVFRFHESSRAARWNTAIDLGCGTGQATVELTRFKKVFGVDPSAKMVDSARQALQVVQQDIPHGQIEYVQSPAENLDFLQPETVDLMIAAQAGHWFDWSKMWPELARVLRKGGSAAIWNYSEFRLPRYPSLSPIITHYHKGTDPLTSVGPYWEQPGRSILDNHLVAIPDARGVVPGVFKDFTRSYFTGVHYPHLPSPRPILMRKTMTWSDLYGYFLSYSALHTFLKHHPEDKLNPDGDISMRFWKSLMTLAGEQDGVEVDGKDNVDVEWPLALIMARKA